MSNPQLKCVQYKVSKRSTDGNVETDNIIQKNFERIGQSLKTIREQLVTLSKGSADINAKIKEIETQTLRYATLKEDIDATLNEIKEVLDDHKKAIESLQGVTLMDNT